MKEYIEREALMEAMQDQGNLYSEIGNFPAEIATENCIELVKDAPAADVVERKHGEWEDEYGGAFANPRYRCSVCKEKSLYRLELDCLGRWHEVQAPTDFCPHCGCDMRGEKRERD